MSLLDFLRMAKTAKVVTVEPNPVTGIVANSIWNGTQAQYDAIAVKDPNTIYLVL